MRLLQYGALLLGASVVDAFQDTSPFFLFSNAELSTPSRTDEFVSSASSLTQNVQKTLSGCQAQSYFIISVPGATSADFATASTAPTLQRQLRSSQTTISVAEVVGDFDIPNVQEYLQKQCKAEIIRVDGIDDEFQLSLVNTTKVVRFDFPLLSVDELERKRALQHTDAFLSNILTTLTTNSKYVLMYATTAGESSEHSIYENAGHHDQEALQDVLRKRAKEDDSQLVDGPLFHRYQFLTPGLFMGLLTAFLLLSILAVGISAVSSLQVSYAAFDKESGPTAQKKQQ